MRIEKIYETPDNSNFFFGYFDIPQLSKDNRYLICQKIDDIKKLPTSKDTHDIYIFDILNKEKKKIGTTKTLNFQQGSRAQWLGPDHKKKIIYNDLNNNSYVSKIYDLETNETSIIPLPVFSVSSDGKFIISGDYERLYWCRKGYSYDGIKNEKKNKKIFKDEKIKLFEIEKNSIKDLFSINDIMNIKKNSAMDNAIHYLEHLMFSPCNKKFIFLHRFKIKDGGIFSRLFEYNLDTKKIKILLDSGRISHFNFIDAKNLILYGSVGNKITKLRKYKFLQIFLKIILKFYKIFVKDNTSLSKKITNDGYYYYNFDSNIFSKIENNQLNLEDGHPTCNKNYKMNFITDNYADNDNGHKASLIFYSKDKNTHKILDKVDSIPALDNSPLRCDLHPRFSYDGNYLSIDAFGKNIRKSIVYRIIKE